MGIQGGIARGHRAGTADFRWIVCSDQRAYHVVQQLSGCSERNDGQNQIAHFTPRDVIVDFICRAQRAIATAEAVGAAALGRAVNVRHCTDLVEYHSCVVFINTGAVRGAGRLGTCTGDGGGAKLEGVGADTSGGGASSQRAAGVIHAVSIERQIHRRGTVVAQRILRFTRRAGLGRELIAGIPMQCATEGICCKAAINLIYCTVTLFTAAMTCTVFPVDRKSLSLPAKYSGSFTGTGDVVTTADA